MHPYIVQLKTPAAALFVVPLFVLLGIAALDFPYAPLQDLPEWIFQGYAFDRLVAGAPSVIYEIKRFPVPYALGQLIISACLVFASPSATSRILLALYTVTVLSAIDRVVVRYGVQQFVGWPIFLSIIALNAPFWNGYVAYQIGLIVLLLYLSLQPEARTDAKIVLLFSILAFFSHGCVFFAFAVFVGVYALHAHRVVQCLLGMLPSFVLLAWYLVGNGLSAKVDMISGVEQANFVFYKIYTLLKVAPYHDPLVFSFNPAVHFGQAYLACGLAVDFVFAVALGVLIVFAVQRTGYRALTLKPEFIAGALLLALTLVLPRTAAGLVNPGERLLYPALIGLTLGLFGDVRLPPAPQAVLAMSVIGGMALFAVGLTAGANAYREEARGAETTNAEKNAAIWREIWFGHRLVQGDAEMKYIERAWALNSMPTLPLGVETGLLATKAATAGSHD
jgi:hypothetical protein